MVLIARFSLLCISERSGLESPQFYSYPDPNAPRYSIERFGPVGIGKLWRGQSMGVVRNRRPEAYRTFMNERRWMYELPHNEMFFAAKASKFGPELKGAFIPIIMDDMIPAYIEKGRKNLEHELTSQKPGRAIDGLVALYQKASRFV